jgi:hypothetical protein
MYFIRNIQLDAFKEVAFRSFENDMVEHIKEYFPNHFSLMKEDDVRKTVRYGHKIAGSYGFVTQRDVCIYLSLMFVLGSNFDADPLYPWAKEILSQGKNENPQTIIDKLSAKSLEISGSIQGKRNFRLNRALTHFLNNSELIFENSRKQDLNTVHSFLSDIYPGKAEVVGEPALNNLVRFGVQKAQIYGISSEQNILLYLLIMFFMGAGFDTDPQMSWAYDILIDTQISDQNLKTKSLFNSAVDLCRNYFSFNPNPGRNV